MLRFRPLIVAQLFLIIASLLAGWMTYQSVTASIGCSAGGDCSSVVTSPWAKLLGMPVALLGLLCYVALLTLLQCRPFQQRHISTLASTLCLLIIGSVLWFMALQIVIIGSYCLYCCATHALAATAALLILWSLYTRFESAPPAIILPLVLSFGGVCAMVALQFFSPAPVQSLTLSTEHHKHGQNEAPALFTLTDKNAPVFTGTSAPILASGSLAPLQIGTGNPRVHHYGLLYDWTCAYCLTMLQHLLELQATSPSASASYQITLLPHYHTEEARRLHIYIHQLSIERPDAYAQLLLEIQHGIVTAAELPRHVGALMAEHHLTPTTPAQDIETLFAIARAQLARNNQILHVETSPQLFSQTQVLTGNPTREELLTFLRQVD